MSSDTIKIRIAVAWDASGHYETFGHKGAPDGELVDEAVTLLGWRRDTHPTRTAILTAELPLPQIEEIPATVEGQE